MNVLLSPTSFGKFDDSPIQRLTEKGLTISLNDSGKMMDASSLSPHLPKIHGVIAGTEAWTADILADAPHLQVISRLGSGIDNVDMEAALSRNIQVFRIPDGPAQPVAELAVGLLIDLLRGISRSDRELRGGQWHKGMGQLISERRIGILGFGAIGQQVRRYLTAFSANVLICDPEPQIQDAHPEEQFLSFDDLVTWADCLFVHLPLTPHTRGLIGVDALKKLGQGGLLLNLARGHIVDEDALFEALDSRQLAGAALDVFAQEPYVGPLRTLDNVILTPHIGAYGRAARVRMEHKAVDHLLEGLSLA